MNYRQGTLFCLTAVTPKRYDFRQCSTCGGTGDQWDSDTDDWAIPMTACTCCEGWGEH